MINPNRRYFENVQNLEDQSAAENNMIHGAGDYMLPKYSKISKTVVRKEIPKMLEEFLEKGGTIITPQKLKVK